MNTMQSVLEKKLAEALAPTHLEVINESHMHAGQQDKKTDGAQKVSHRA